MRKLLATLCTAAALALAANPARAEIAWNYIGTPEVSKTSGGSTVTFLGTVGAAANNSGVVIFNITADSTTSNDGPPDPFSEKFFLSVTIIDGEALKTGKGDVFDTVTFEGTFSADISKGSLTNWKMEWDVDEGNVTLGNDEPLVGHRKYNIKIDGVLPPSPNNPTVAGRGTVHANVTILELDTGGGPPPDPSDTPEPSSLLLAGLGLLGAASWRRRKQKMMA